MLLSLSINDVNRMQLEFNEVYQSLFEEGYKRLDNAFEIKLKTIQTCEKFYNSKSRKEITDFKAVLKHKSGQEHSYQIKAFDFECLENWQEHDHDHSSSEDLFAEE